MARTSLSQEELARRLAAARERAAVTQQQAADALGVPRTAISQIESGNRAVSGLELVRLAQLYRVDVGDLIEGRDPEGELVALFRMDPLLAKDDVQEEVREVLRVCKIIADLEEVLNELPVATSIRESLPTPSTRARAEEQGRDLALRHRERLGLGFLPIGDMHALLIRQGIGVAEHDLPDQVSGIFLSAAGQRPFILVNKAHKGTRRRFSLAHEFCHAITDNAQRVLVSRGEDVSFREKRADAFASSFLLPREAILEFATELAVKPNEFNFTQVADLSYRYGVSYEAATVQLRSLRLISNETWSTFKGEARRAAGYLHKKYPEKAAAMVRVSLREWAFGRMLRAYEQQVISRRKALAVAKELGYNEEAVESSLSLLTPSSGA